MCFRAGYLGYLYINVTPFFSFCLPSDLRNSTSKKRFPNRSNKPSINSPSYAEDPVENPLTNQSHTKKNETPIGTIINIGANHNSNRNNSFWIFSFRVSFLLSIHDHLKLKRIEHRWK